MRSKLVIGGLGAAVAFLLATNPVVAQAAGFITSADIVNSTIKSGDVKNNSLTGADVAESSLSVVPNATRLRGQPASAYLNTSYRFLLPIGGAATQSKSFTFEGLPPGNYLATYSVVGRLSGQGNLGCHLRTSASSARLEAYNWGMQAGIDSASSGSAPLTLTAAAPVLTCSTFNGVAPNWVVFNDANIPSQVTFTKVNAVVGKAVTASPSASLRGGPGS